MTFIPHITWKHVVISFTLSALLVPSAYALEPGFYIYDKESKKVRVSGRIYHTAPGQVLVEVWPRPLRKHIKVSKISLTSPSGKKYSSGELNNFPMSQTMSRRAQLLNLSSRFSEEEKDSSIWAKIEDLLISQAHASCAADHVESSGGSGGDSDDGDSRRNAEAFAAFGVLAGIAGQQEKHWVTSGIFSVEEEPGEWITKIMVVDNTGKKHRFTIPFNLSCISTPEEIALENSDEASVSSTDSRTGITTTVVTHADGSRTVTMTDSDGNELSTVEKPPRTGTTTTHIDPETGYTVTTTTNPNGSISTTAKDADGNWVTTTRWPGGKPEPEPDGAAPEPEPCPATKEDPEEEKDPDPVIDELTPWPWPGTVVRGDPPPAVGGDDDGDDPRDAPPPVIYGEEIDEEELPLGILLERDDDDWIPEFDNRTTVTAQLYEKPAGSYTWVISHAKRILTVFFEERSNETGRSMNRDLRYADEESPDLFMSEARNPDCECYDDPSGSGYHYEKCVTKDHVSLHTFVVSSEDYGSFSKMQATSPGCVQLMRLSNGNVVEANIDVGQHLVDVPQDENENQIADGYEREKGKEPNATDDDDARPEGDGTAGDGFSAYEEYRGFFIKGESDIVRTKWDKKTLFFYNIPGYPGVETFGNVSYVEAYEINSDGHEDRVANYNSGHANLVDQHCLIIESSTTSSDGPSGRVTDFGPPKNCERIYIYPAQHRDPGDIGDTVVHESGHAVGMRHHGDIEHTKEYWYPPTGTWRDHIPWRNVHTGPKYCWIPLPDIIRRGHKGDQSSGVVRCYMRYKYHGYVYPEPDGTETCIGYHPGYTQFCDTSVGTLFNSAGRTASNATRGNCKGQLIVNDNS